MVFRDESPEERISSECQEPSEFTVRPDGQIVEFFAYETVGAAITRTEPIVRLEHGDLIVYMSQQSYDELLTIEDDDERYRRFCQMLEVEATDESPGEHGAVAG